MRAPNRENASGPKGHGALFFTTPTALGFLPRGIKIKRDTRGPKWSAIVRLEKNMHMVKSRAPWCKLHGALLFTGWVVKTRAPHPPPLKITTGLCTRGPRARRSTFYQVHVFLRRTMALHLEPRVSFLYHVVKTRAP